MEKSLHIFRMGEHTAREQVNLSNQVFNHNRTEFDWLYKHKDNPLAKQYNVFGALYDGKLVGINGFMPMLFKINDIEINAMQSCDTAIDENFRGLGIFTKIVSYAEQEFKKQNIDVMIGFPNHNSYPGFIKMGWIHLFDYNNIIMPCRVKPFSNHFLGFPLPDKLSIVFTRKVIKLSKQKPMLDIYVSDTIPFSQAEFDEINRTDKIELLRSFSIYTWKLDKNKKKNFKYYIAKKNGKILAFLIAEEGFHPNTSIKRTNIIDWGFSNNYRDVLINATAQILNILIQETDLISLWGPAEIEYKRIFQKNGFFQNQRITQTHPVIIKIINNDQEIKNTLLDPMNWRLKGIEVDTLV